LSDISYVARSLEGSSTELIVGSIRNTKDIERIVSAFPQVITIPFGIVKKLENIRKLKATGLIHPMTQYTIEEFEKAAGIYKE